MSFFKEMFGRNEKPRYSFELINNSLIREDRNKIAELITQVDAGQSTEEKMAPWTELTKLVSDRFEDLKVSTDEDSIANFIKTFAQLPHKQNYSEAAPTSTISKSEIGAPETQAELKNDSADIEPASRVVPTRVKPWSQFDGIEPVAQATIVTPEIISAQQRGLGVTANPEQGSSNGEAAMERLIAEAGAIVPEQLPKKYTSPYEGDSPIHRVQNDLPPSSANIDWEGPAGPETLVHPKPPEHLVK